ncbi:hypothetical protein JL721_10848 [Aureococcus anophagefferens]|nr:hypothetical protein JL721_10848 [Aureococcus anophagefferens]
MPPRTRAGADGGDDDEPTLLSIVELNKLCKDVIVFTPQSGVHDANKALFRGWTRSIMLHAPVLEIVGRHAKADFETIYDSEWAKINQSERPQAEHMLMDDDRRSTEKGKGTTGYHTWLEANYSKAFYVGESRRGVSGGRQDLEFEASIAVYVNRPHYAKFLEAILVDPQHRNILKTSARPRRVRWKRTAF